MDVLYRQSPEYSRLVEERERYRLFGHHDYYEVKWVESVLDRLERKQFFDSYTERDLLDIRKAKEVMARIAAKANFNPSQARVPAGNPTGGRWTGEGVQLPARRPSNLSRDDDSHILLPTRKPHFSDQIHPLRAYPFNKNPSPAKYVTGRGHMQITIHHEDGSAEVRSGGDLVHGGIITRAIFGRVLLLKGTAA